MPTITRIFKVITDANGTFETTQTINPPGPFGFTVRLKAKFVAPDDTTINGTLDCDAADGNPQNNAKVFSISTGDTADLGEWQLDGGDNIVRIRGQSEPVRANTETEIEVTAEI